MKKFVVEFTHGSGKVEEVEFITDRIEWTIEQYARNRYITEHKIISEGSSNSKRMLFG